MKLAPAKLIVPRTQSTSTLLFGRGFQKSLFHSSANRISFGFVSSPKKTETAVSDVKNVRSGVFICTSSESRAQALVNFGFGKANFGELPTIYGCLPPIFRGRTVTKNMFGGSDQSEGKLEPDTSTEIVSPAIFKVSPENFANQTVSLLTFGNKLTSTSTTNEPKLFGLETSSGSEGTVGNLNSNSNRGFGIKLFGTPETPLAVKTEDSNYPKADDCVALSALATTSTENVFKNFAEDIPGAQEVDVRFKNSELAQEFNTVEDLRGGIYEPEIIKEEEEDDDEDIHSLLYKNESVRGFDRARLRWFMTLRYLARAWRESHRWTFASDADAQELHICFTAGRIDVLCEV